MSRPQKAVWAVARALAHGMGIACMVVCAALIFLDMDSYHPGEPHFWAESWWFGTAVMLGFAAILLLALSLLTKLVTRRPFGKIMGMMARAVGYGAILSVLGAVCILVLGLLTGSVTGPLIEAQRTAFWLNN